VTFAREHHAVPSRDFPFFTERSRFTDDTVLPVATASAILSDGDYGAALHAFGRRYPNAGLTDDLREVVDRSSAKYLRPHTPGGIR